MKQKFSKQVASLKSVRFEGPKENRNCAITLYGKIKASELASLLIEGAIACHCMSQKNL